MTRKNFLLCVPCKYLQGTLYHIFFRKNQFLVAYDNDDYHKQRFNSKLAAVGMPCHTKTFAISKSARSLKTIYQQETLRFRWER